MPWPHDTEPGGHIQWEDAELIHQESKGTMQSILLAWCENYSDMQAFNTSKLLDQIHSELVSWSYMRWVVELPIRLLLQGFELKRASAKRSQNDPKKLWTSTYLLALGEILKGVKWNSGGQHPVSVEEHDKARALHQLLPESRWNDLQLDSQYFFF